MSQLTSGQGVAPVNGWVQCRTTRFALIVPILAAKKYKFVGVRVGKTRNVLYQRSERRDLKSWRSPNWFAVPMCL